MMRNLKLVAVGDGAVGKTSLMMVFATGAFPGDYTPTVFDSFVAHTTVDDVKVSLSLWDTAGQEDYARLRPLSYPNSDVFLVCFSTISQASFENVKANWIPEVRHHCPDLPIILVGTKVDQRDNPAVVSELEKSGRGAISYADGLKLAKDIGAYAYIECSALRGKKVTTVFETAARAVIAPKEPRKPRKTRCSIM